MLPQIPNIAKFGIFLDLDGTIAEIANHPICAKVGSSTIEILEDLYPRVGKALAIISGREIEVIDRMLHPLVLPAAGLHGLEWRIDASSIEKETVLDLTSISVIIEKKINTYDGVFLENKKGSLALHFRNNPSLERLCRKTILEITNLRSDLESLNGKMVIELLPKNINKGRAISRFLNTFPFIDQIPLFAGDDETDEAGFTTVNNFNGITIKIGDGLTNAKYRADNVDQFLNWLRSCLIVEVERTNI